MIACVVSANRIHTVKYLLNGVFVCRLPITIKWWLKEWSDRFAVCMRAAHTHRWRTAYAGQQCLITNSECWNEWEIIFISIFFARISDDKIRTTLTRNLRYFIWLGEKFQAWTRARTALVNICAIRCVLLYTLTSGIALSLIFIYFFGIFFLRFFLCLCSLSASNILWFGGFSVDAIISIEICIVCLCSVCATFFSLHLLFSFSSASLFAFHSFS